MTAHQPPIRLREVAALDARIVAGLMTGTSLDGLDVVLARLPAGEPRSFELLAHASEPMPVELRERLVSPERLDVVAIASLHREIGEWYARATDTLVRSAGVRVDLVGMHGQTVWHEHGRVTVQLGDPHFLASALGCPVVSGFRHADIAAGGCGAPLVAAFDRWMLSDPAHGVIALNLGGIANLTAMAPRGRPGILGFDCGPANMVLDGLAQRVTGGAQRYDVDGAFARQGRVRRELLEALLRDPYFTTPPPKSTGREQFGLPYVDALIAMAAPSVEQDWHNLFATASALTVESVAQAIERFVPASFDCREIVVGGGGSANPHLMASLETRFPLQVTSSEARGVPPSLKEALAFAVLANARLDGIPGNVPEVTGARAPVLCGQFTEL